jgi:hypothetical protein
MVFKFAIFHNLYQMKFEVILQQNHYKIALETSF